MFGQTHDATTGLTHMGARDYDPGTQTFTSADTITPSATSKGLNRFAYANGNPANATDPSGHDPAFCTPSGDCHGGAAPGGSPLGGFPSASKPAVPTYVANKHRDGSLKGLAFAVQWCAGQWNHCYADNDGEYRLARAYLQSLIDAGLVQLNPGSGPYSLVPGPAIQGKNFDISVWGNSLTDYSIVMKTWTPDMKDSLDGFISDAAPFIDLVAIVGYATCGESGGIGCAVARAADAVSLYAAGTSVANNCGELSASCGFALMSFGVSTGGGAIAEGVEAAGNIELANSVAMLSNTVNLSIDVSAMVFAPNSGDAPDIVSTFTVGQ